MPRNRQRCTGRTLEVQLRRERAVALRIDGKTYREISEILGCSLNRARAMVLEAQEVSARTMREQASELIELEEQRLDKMWEALLPGMFAPEAKYRARCIEVGLKIMERRAKLRGLDAPVKQEVMMGVVDMSDAELISTAKRLGLKHVVDESPQLSLDTLIQEPLPGEDEDTNAAGRVLLLDVRVDGSSEVAGDSAEVLG